MLLNKLNEKTSRNTTYENLWEITKAVQKKMFISRRLKVMLMLHMKFKKKYKIYLKSTRRKEIIKIRAKINREKYMWPVKRRWLITTDTVIQRNCKELLLIIEVYNSWTHTLTKYWKRCHLQALVQRQNIFINEMPEKIIDSIYTLYHTQK